jgi:hypothetical protein
VLLRLVQGFNCIAVASLLQGLIFFPFAKLLNRASLRGSRGYEVAYLDSISVVVALVSGTLGVFVRRRHRAFLFTRPLPNEQVSDASTCLLSTLALAAVHHERTNLKLHP